MEGQGFQHLVDAYMALRQNAPAVVDVVERRLTEWGVNRAVEVVRGAFQRARPHIPEADAVAADRERDVVEGIADEMKRRGPSWDAERAGREAVEPGFEHFVDAAAEAGTSSRSEAKRRLIGRLIARRLQGDGSDATDAVLERAITVMPGLSERQHLVALAAIVLTHRVDEAGNPRSIEEAETLLQSHFGRALTAIANGEGWSSADLETLATYGLLRTSLRRESLWTGSDGADSVQRWLTLHGLTLHSLLGNDAGTKEAHDRFATAFPTIHLATAIALGKLFEADNPLPYRLDSLYPSPVGDLLGTIVLDQLNEMM